jgi:single stranded DNA-binding protein
MNIICVTGRLTADPVHRPASLDDGVSARSEFRLAINGPRSERDEDRATFITVVAYNATAVAVADHLARGALVGVHGRLEQREWDDQNGHHSIYRIVSHRVEFLERRGTATDLAAA